MAQVKIYALESALQNIRQSLSALIHNCVVETLSFPKEKRFHRFFPLQKEDFLVPEDKSDHYMIIEIMMMEGRSVETKKRLIQMLFQSIHHKFSIAMDDIEIVIVESPASHWGFRGMSGDEIKLNYEVNV